MNNLTTTEILDIVDVKGNIISTATRSMCHGDPSLIHRVVHIHVLNTKKQFFLQKRPSFKTVQPSKWDTSVGGHVESGESIEEACIRETKEELNITSIEFVPVFNYHHSNELESELVYTFYLFFDRCPDFNTSEIDDGRFWDISEISENMGKGILTPNFESEFQKLTPLFPNIF